MKRPKGHPSQNVAVLVGFRAAYVFDVSQTEGASFPNLPARSATWRVPRPSD